MKVAIRADASINMGTGHIMRCLTLADNLKKNGADIHFFCRPHKGSMTSFIESKDYPVSLLNPPQEINTNDKYIKLLGCSEIQDSNQFINRLEEKFDLIIVDNYGISDVWLDEVKPYCDMIMVIDDLSETPFKCDILLNQNLGTTKNKYENNFLKSSNILVGNKYTLLRDEFLEWREYSLNRRISPSLNNILINLGGSDPQNITSNIVNIMENSNLSSKISLTIILGEASIHIGKLKKSIKKSKFSVDIKIGINNMAELLSKCDLAIGAAGSSSWERCYLGVPSILYSIADNQKAIAMALKKHDAVELLEDINYLPEILNNLSTKRLKELSIKSKKLIDGKGSSRVSDIIFKRYLQFNSYRLVPYQNLNEEESQSILKMRNHKNIRRWMNHKEVISNEEHISFINKLDSLSDKRYLLAFKKGEIIGSINFTGIKNGNADFGIYTNPFNDIKGKGTVLMFLAINYAKNELKLDKINLTVIRENLIAINLYTKFGFIKMDKCLSKKHTLLSMFKVLK